MGCASSKRIDTKVATDVYKPPPSSFAVFDINSIQEPWLTTAAAEEPEKPPPPSTTASKGHGVSTPILEKISKFETLTDAPPRSWDEVSKALAKEREQFKPVQPPATSANQPGPVPAPASAPSRSLSFHTLEELDKKLKQSSSFSKAPEKTNARSDPPGRAESTRSESREDVVGGAGSGTVTKSVRDNPFIVRDRMEREKGGKLAAYDRMMSYKRDPLAGYPERCPPGGENSLVVYTTSLRGVRRTHEDCTRVRSILEGHRVVFDERDVSLDAGFLGELRALLGEESGAGVPRVFLKGRDLGGVEQVVDLNESGRLGRMLGWAGVERGVGWQACEGCGGARFVPCLVCGGSCKVVVGEARERCGFCNENGLVRCPACL